MSHSTRNPELFVRLVFGVLGACLLLNILNWLLYGLDIPYWDDWRPYLLGEAGDFSLKTLFHPVNDTLYPVGLALDALAQRFLLGNSLVYQFLSMSVVLGGLLILQWRLLVKALGDRVLAACASSALLLMLQPGSYWGLQNMAYHQALPLLALLYALDLIYCQTWRGRISPLLIFVTGLFAGMTYISGAFAILAAGIGLLISAAFTSDRRSNVITGGTALLLSGFMTSIPQGWVIAFYQKGSHNGAPLALPIELDFWMFLLGEMGRSLILPIDQPLLAIAWVGLSLSLLLVSLVWLAKAARHTSRAPSENKLGSDLLKDHLGIYVAIGSAVAAYIFLVAAGRANVRDPSISAPIDVFLHGFQRFHFFWLTALWPWLIATVLAYLRPRIQGIRIPITLAAVVILVCGFNGAFAHSSYYRTAATDRLLGLRCLEDRLEAGLPLICESLYPATDLTQALHFADQAGSSFSRSLTLDTSVEVGFGAAAPFPLELKEGDALVSTFPAERIVGEINSLGIFVGTHGGKSNGTMRLEICQGLRCSVAERSIVDAQDNDFMAVTFDKSLDIFSDQPVTVTASTHGTSFPIAIWSYPAHPEWGGTQNLVRESGEHELRTDTSARMKFAFDRDVPRRLRGPG